MRPAHQRHTPFPRRQCTPIPTFLDVSLAKCRIVDIATLARAVTALRHLRRARKQLLMIGTIKRPRHTLTHIRTVPGLVTEKAARLCATDIPSTRGILPIHLRTLALAVITTERTERTHPRRATMSIHHPRTVYTRARPTRASGARTTRTSG